MRETLTLRFIPRSFSRRRARGRIYPCWPCSSASSPVFDRYPSSACLYPHPPSRGYVRADTHSSLCVLSASYEPPSPSHSFASISHQQTRSQKRPPGNARTGISRHLVQPLRPLLPIPSFTPPSRDPRLPLVFPHFLIAMLGLDTFSACEAFPFSWKF